MSQFSDFHFCSFCILTLSTFNLSLLFHVSFILIAFHSSDSFYVILYPQQPSNKISSPFWCAELTQADFWTMLTLSHIVDSMAVLSKKARWVEQLEKFMYGSSAASFPNIAYARHMFTRIYTCIHTYR